MYERRKHFIGETGVIDPFVQRIIANPQFPYLLFLIPK